jgi:hypothetical protein
MKCEELQDYYELYAMGVAGEPEGDEIRSHLSRQCEVCMAGIKKARAFTSFLGNTAPAMAPSPQLRRRILASVGFEQRRFGLAPFLGFALACALFAAFYFSGREREFATIALRLREQLGEQTVQLTRLNEAFAILNGPDTQTVSFGVGQPAPPKGRIFLNPSQGVLLIASNLSPAPAGKKYEMWVIPKGGKPVPAGLFQSETDGTAMHIRRGAVDPATTGAVAVTLENEAGALEPTMPILIVAPLQ